METDSQKFWRERLPLVEALARGETIQLSDCGGGWIDMDEPPSLSLPISDYRIKPKPREFWVNEYEKNDASGRAWETREEAEHANVGRRVALIRAVEVERFP